MKSERTSEIGIHEQPDLLVWQSICYNSKWLSALSSLMQIRNNFGIVSLILILIKPETEPSQLLRDCAGELMVGRSRAVGVTEPALACSAVSFPLLFVLPLSALSLLRFRAPEK